MDNKVQNFIDCKDKFNIRFSNIKFILTEECVRKIKNSTLGTLNNCNIEEICNSLKNNNKNLLVKIVNVILLPRPYNDIGLFSERGALFRPPILQARNHGKEFLIKNQRKLTFHYL